MRCGRYNYEEAVLPSSPRHFCSVGKDDTVFLTMNRINACMNPAGPGKI